MTATRSLLGLALCLAVALGKPNHSSNKSGPPALLAQPDEPAPGPKTCETLMYAEELPFRVATNMGVTETCAAAKIPGHFGCHVSNISYPNAELACESVGARLCTFAEINSNAARGLGCHGLYEEDSYCWVSDGGSQCAEDEVLATRCRHYNAGKHQPDPAAGHTVCRKKDNVAEQPGSLVCCATGGPDFAAITAERPENRELSAGEQKCSDIKCGADCTGRCGWSSHGFCRAGQRTAPREMLEGECDHIDR